MRPYDLPEDRRVYAIGDIHGEARLLDLLLEKIRRHAEAHPVAHPLLIYLGDYIDRGPDSASVIRRLLAGPPEGFEQVALMGNHEEMLLACLEGEAAMIRRWLRNGGDAACRSYGVDPDQAPQLVSQALREAMPQEDRELLRGLPLFHREGGYFFVHAGIRPGIALDQQRREDLIWIRKPFHDSEADHGGIVVHGHSPVPVPEVLPNRINIDTGAVYGNALTAVVLAGADHSFLQVPADRERPARRHPMI